VVLPPGVAPADLLRRLLAFLIDLLPILALAFVVFPIPADVSVKEFIRLADQRHTPNNVAYALAAALTLHIVYCTLAEYRFGTTLGKALLKLRVIGDQGTPPTLRQLAVRNVLKIVELLWPPNLPLLILMPVLNRGRQRLGDLFARTIVVSAAAVPPAPPPGEDPPG
jgi:uncharacterized RDD family membrane protein YckC